MSDGALFDKVYCPIDNGRSISDFLQLIGALQTCDKNNVITPKNCTAVEFVVLPTS